MNETTKRTLMKTTFGGWLIRRSNAIKSRDKAINSLKSLNLQLAMRIWQLERSEDEWVLKTLNT